MRVLRIVLFMLAATLLRYRFLISCCPLLPSILLTLLLWPRNTQTGEIAWFNSFFLEYSFFLARLNA
jgi:hypothetical protein